jgi:hypothetical protein
LTWLEKEQSKLLLYIGRFGGLKQPDDNEWTKEINVAERLLIYHCYPPYNSHYINDPILNGITKTIILNFGYRHKLPLEISTLANETDYSVQSSKWKTYSWKE